MSECVVKVRHILPNGSVLIYPDRDAPKHPIYRNPENIPLAIRGFALVDTEKKIVLARVTEDGAPA